MALPSLIPSAGRARLSLVCRRLTATITSPFGAKVIVSWNQRQWPTRSIWRTSSQRPFGLAASAAVLR
jgi:hypothetical protein